MRFLCFHFHTVTLQFLNSQFSNSNMVVQIYTSFPEKLCCGLGCGVFHSNFDARHSEVQSQMDDEDTKFPFHSVLFFGRNPTPTASTIACLALRGKILKPNRDWRRLCRFSPVGVQIHHERTDGRIRQMDRQTDRQAQAHTRYTDTHPDTHTQTQTPTVSYTQTHTPSLRRTNSHTYT